MAVNLIAHDTRLAGRTPSSSRETQTIEVDDSTSLDDFFTQAVEIAYGGSGIGRLAIMAHGVYVSSMDTTAIQFCREMISLQTVHHFSRLRGLVDTIVLYVCHAAETSMTRRGDGDELCRHIALESNAEVTAARETQDYTTTESCRFFVDCETSAIEFGDWEGTVVHYGRDGRVLAEFADTRRAGPGARGSSRSTGDPRFPSAR
jgi:hypothetical protein